MIKEKVNNIFIFLALILTSILISYTYYFDHLAVVNTLVLYDSEIYKDKTNLFYLMQSNLSSFLFVIINFFIKIGFSLNFLNLSLTFIPTLLNLSGIYLICKFITYSNTLSFLISFAAISLTKNFGEVDYPTLMFSWHTVGMFAFSLCTFILGLLTLRNLLFAFLACLLLSSIHLVVGLWMIGITTLSSYFFISKKNVKKIGVIIFISLIVILFHVNGFLNYTEIPFEFNQKDYDDYFNYVEAHRTNYGNMGYMYTDYVLKSLILLVLIYLFLKFNLPYKESNNKFFFITLTLSIICSGTIFFTYKLFPQFFPEIAIRIIPPRFFLIHSIVGYPIIISIIFKFLENFFNKRKYNKNLSSILISIIIILHLIQHNDVIKSRFSNIEKIKENKIEEKLFWKKVNNLNPDGYIFTSNNLCYKTISYTNFPILFCFDQLDYIPYLPKLASPIRKITNELLGLSYDKLKYKNLGGISDIEVKKSFENKSVEEWDNLRKKFNFNTIIVPKDWILNLNLIIDGKYKVYKIK